LQQGKKGRNAPPVIAVGLTVNEFGAPPSMENVAELGFPAMAVPKREIMVPKKRGECYDDEL
jgi:hypothetical protein